MNSQLTFTFVYILGFISLIVICELLHKKLNIHSEYTRKLGHSASTLVCLFFPVIFQSYSYVVILGVFSFVLLFSGKYLKLFKSIDSVDRKTEGSYLLPVSICSLFIFSGEDTLLFILPILVLGISDPLAGIFGRIYKAKTKNVILFNHKFEKTLLGSIVFSISAFLISIISLHLFLYNGNKLFLLSLFIAFITTLVEIISPNGSDNITVPYSVSFFLYIQQIII